MTTEQRLHLIDLLKKRLETNDLLLELAEELEDNIVIRLLVYTCNADMELSNNLLTIANKP